MVPTPCNAHTSAYNPCMVHLKPIFAGLCASAVTYLCFLAWVHSKAVSLAEERGTIGLVPIASSQSQVLHSPTFWALAIIGFGVGFFLFRDG